MTMTVRTALASSLDLEGARQRYKAVFEPTQYYPSPDGTTTSSTWETVLIYGGEGYCDVVSMSESPLRYDVPGMLGVYLKDVIGLALKQALQGEFKSYPNETLIRVPYSREEVSLILLQMGFVVKWRSR